MPIARLPSDDEAIAAGFGGVACQRRREVLRETLAALGGDEVPSRFHRLAAANLERWRAAAAPANAGRVLVVRGDWGEVTGDLTQRFGRCFAALNMANAYYPGGAYGEGAPAQEENMFRRSDCHFRVQAGELDGDGRTYRPAISRLLQGLDRRVHLDTTHPRVCVRGPERRDRADLGYEWLPEDEVFPFLELRASARDLRGGLPFDAAAAEGTIEAILETLVDAGVRHVVLGALGCGAFENPAAEVARLFREGLSARSGAFDVVAFAIYDPGYGPDNYTPFARALGGAD